MICKIGKWEYFIYDELIYWCHFVVLDTPLLALTSFSMN